MLKNKYFRPVLCSLTATVMSLAFMATSCNKTKKEWNPLIIFTDNQVCHTTLDVVNHSCTARFDDFHYVDFPSFNKVTVKQDYSYGYARFNSYIGNLDQTNRTFSVFVYASYIKECVISSPFTFYYEDQPLPVSATQNNFTIHIESKTAVLYEGAVHQEGQINANDAVSFTFSNFKILNISNFDPSKLKVSQTFTQQQPSASVQAIIRPALLPTIFDLELNFTNVFAGVLDSKLIFTYNDVPLDEQLPYSFQLTLIAKPTIYIPTTPILNCVINPNTCRLTIPGFAFVSLSEEDQDRITVENDFSLENGSVTTNITNWNQKKQTFDIELSCTDVQTLPHDLVSGHICFKLDDEYISDTTYEFHLDFVRPIPNSHIVYSSDWFEMSSTDGHLQELTYETNCLYVPSFVQKIGQYFVTSADLDFFVQHPHELLFEDKLMLKSIGEAAFRDVPFANDIVLPYSLQTIENQAFFKSPSTKTIDLRNARSLISIGESGFQTSKFTGDVFIHKNIETVGDDAFASSLFDGCITIESNITDIGEKCFAGMPNIKEIDLSSWTEIPDWMQQQDNQVFQNIGSGVLSPSSKGTVWISPFVSETDIKQKLIDFCLLPEDLWNIVVKE